MIFIRKTAWVDKTAVCGTKTFAVLFISLANSSTEPLQYSASAIAASLPLSSKSPYNKSCTVMTSPSFRPHTDDEWPGFAASWLTVTVAFKSQFLRIMYAVKIFVVLAG